ncbi:MAG: hypothetical protein A3E81_01675 [Gammaproteobacteria bacterium RIFCSPHIGHO2_12_FULL_36_30]|nr:MAG: hypothetical protein A3E81_01675 [Gammaproteobacteria bacterium RIFCSPHIGHO2_12_FULL_36_30]
MKIIEIVTDADFLPGPTENTVGLLLECAPDSMIANKYKNIFFIDELLGEFDEKKKMACDFADQIFQNEPKFRGVKQLSIFKEMVISRIFEIFQIIHLYYFLINKHYTLCRFYCYSRYAKILSDLCKIDRSVLIVEFPPPPTEKNKFFRRLRIFFTSFFSLSELMQHTSWILNRIDRFHRRRIFISHFFKRKVRRDKNNLWFVSYGRNYTNIGLFYEPFFPHSFNFLIDDVLTGGKPLVKKKRFFFNLYDYGKENLIPSKGEINFVKSEIEKYIALLPMCNVNVIARKLFLKDALLKDFFLIHLPAGLYATSLHLRWFALENPSAIIVGNNAFEAYALSIAREKGIPTILLQHGILGDYYQFLDSQVSSYIVYGEFWRNFLVSSAKKRAIIIHPATNKTVVNHHTAKKNNRKSFVVYFSPLYAQVDKKNRFYVETDSQLLSIAREVAVAGAKLIIRFHPLDHITLHRNHIKKLYKNNMIDVQVEYNYKENISDLLNGAAAAIMYFSTVFMDCVKSGIPVISYDWLHFPLKKHIAPHEIFNFAKNLQELRTLIRKALSSELLPSNIDKKLFLCETTDVEAKAVFRKLVVQSK